jgi:hypothetical protein
LLSFYRLGRFPGIRILVEMVQIRRKTLLLCELWFDEPWSVQGADVLLFYNWSQAVAGAESTEVNSLALELAAAKEEIWSGFSSSTRNQINRATREGVRHRIVSEPALRDIDEFFAFYKRFATERHLGGEDHPLWMREYAQQGALVLTNARVENEPPLVWHTYYCKAPWVRQLHSVSLFSDTEDREKRNLIARANRYLHWADINEFRDRGILHFDFGGWYAGHENDKLLRVNAFKEEFGGIRTKRFHCTLPVSFKGRVFLKVRARFRGPNSTLHQV